MNRFRRLLQALHIIPKDECAPTRDQLLRAEIERRTREMEARLRMNDLELRNIQRKN